MADLITLADVKAALEITSTDDDVFLTRAIAEASAQIQAYTRRTLILDAFVHRFVTPPPRHVLVLPQFPVQAITAMSSDGAPLDVSAYLLDSRPGYLEPAAMGWGNGKRLEIAYSAGESPLPAELSGVVIALLQARLAAKGQTASTGAAAGTLKSETIFDVGKVDYVTDAASVAAASAASSGWNALLAPFLDVLSQYRDLSRNAIQYHV